MFIYKYCIYNELDDSNVFGCVYGLYQGGCDTLPMVLSNEELMLGYIQLRELESTYKSGRSMNLSPKRKVLIWQICYILALMNLLLYRDQ